MEAKNSPVRQRIDYEGLVLDAMPIMGLYSRWGDLYENPNRKTFSKFMGSCAYNWFALSAIFFGMQATLESLVK